MTGAIPFSRRTFGRLVGAGVAGAALRPIPAGALSPDEGGVRLSANENPYGPAPGALQAMREAFRVAWRYPDEEAGELIADLSRLHGVASDSILLGAGSSEILNLAAAAFTGPGRKLVMGDPAFEPIGAHARVRGAEVIAVPLDGAYAHDLGKMAVAGSGLVYICNPNNPTGSITPRGKVRAFLDALPASSMALVDEAYHHYVDSPDYESVIPLVKTHPGLIVARTFSKIYGMAGLRLGYAVAQPAVIKKLSAQGAFDSVNVIALAAARASLADAGHVAEGVKRNAATKTQVLAELRRLGYQALPSQTNFVMIDTRKQVLPTIKALRDRGVQVGRLFPALPQHLRVTLGRPEQMKRFLEAFAAVMV